MIRRNRRTRFIKKGDCDFCKTKSVPDYKNVSILRNYISERGKIIGRMRTGVCPKHQRLVTREIKRARYLALLPFISKI